MKTHKIIFPVMFFLILLPARSYAYIDPGTGSFVVQMLIAAVLGAFFALKMYWQRLRTFFSKLLAKKMEDPDDTSSK